MPKKNDTEQNLSKLLKVFRADNIISSDEIEEVLSALVGILAENKKSVEGLNAETKEYINKAVEQITSDHSNVLNEIGTQTQLSKKEIEKLVKEQNDRSFKRVQELINNIKMPKDGKDGKDADEGAVVSKVLAQIKLPENKVITPEEVKEQLETLEDDDKDALFTLLGSKKLKGLEDTMETRFADALNRIRLTSGKVKTLIAGSNVTVTNDGDGNYTISSTGGGGSVSDDAYDSSWDGVTDTAPSQNAVYDKIEALVLGSGTGDVVGPASSTDNAIVRFDGTGGKTGQNSGVTIDDNGAIDAATFVTGNISPKVYKYVVDSAGNGDYTTIEDALTALGANAGRIKVMPGTYTAPSTGFGWRSDQFIEGSGQNVTIISADDITSGYVFFDAVSPTRIYRGGISDLTITRTSKTSGVSGINLTNWSSGTFSNVQITNMDVALYGNGLNYYNEFYAFDLLSNNHNLYAEGASNEWHFFGGSWKDAATKQLYVTNSNQITFTTVAFEGADQVFDIATGTFGVSFTNCRVETSGTSTFTAASGTYGIDIIGGRWSNVVITDNGSGNHIITDSYKMVLNSRTNALTGLSITRSGSGMTSSTPALEIIDTYAASGTPTTLRLVNPRFGGQLISAETATTPVFTVGGLGAVSGLSFTPNANDGGALGASGTAFSDLFLASGAVINFNAGDITLTHSADTLALAGGDLTVTGNQRNSGYMRVGSTSAPTNTTAGDLTALRLSLGNSASFSASARFVDIRGTTTDTASGAAVFSNFVNSVVPASNSSSEFRALYFRNAPNAATGITLTTLAGGFFEGARYGSTQDGLISNIFGSRLWGMVVDSGSVATALATTVTGSEILGHVRTSGTSTSTVTTVMGADVTGVSSGAVTATDVLGIRVKDSGAGNTITNAYGIDIASQTRGATKNIGLRVGLASGATTNAAIQLSDTTGVVGGGILFGTDTTLHRSGANVLALNGDLTVTDEAYGAGWNGSLEVPTKNAVYDKIEAIAAGNLADGDYGDVAVSSSGTVFTVESIGGFTFTPADAGADAFLGWDDSVGAYENLTQAEARTILGLGDAAFVTTDLANLNESTIEAAIDTLANLTSVQGRTVTLADAGADVLFGWDDSGSAYKNFALTDITTEAAPAAGDFLLAYTAEGALVKIDWDDLPGSGDVVGPASATDNAVARFDSTTGKLIQDSALTVNDDGRIATPNDTGGITFAGGSGNATTLKTGTDGTFLFDTGANMDIKFKGNTAGDTDWGYTNESFVYVWKSDSAGNSTQSGKATISGTIELGHATDTTLSRSAAGVLAVEGVDVVTLSATQTLTNKTLTSPKINENVAVTSTATELNILDGATLSTTELNYVDGVTSAIQTQLDAKLALAGGTMTGNITLGENTSIALDPAGSADGKYSGITVAGTAGATLAFGDLVYLAAADSRWELADADAASTSGDVMLGMCVLAAAADGDPTTILLHGIIRADTAFPALTVSAQVYVSTTAGDIQVAQPSGTDDVIRVVGRALTADEIYFNPSEDYLTHT